VLCEVVRDDGEMARLPDLKAFADEHGLLVISIADLIRYRRQKDKLVKRVAEARIPTTYGEFTCYAYESVLNRDRHVALVKGAVQGEQNVLVRVHSEGRGIGLAHKLRAYTLQEGGRDTVDANLDLGLPVDSREYGIGAQILVDLGITTMRYMTNNPAKYGGLEGFGLEMVERVPLIPVPTPENIRYLRTKRERMGHALEGLDDTV
jgi:3,4-dihydroxy 2-butanone 4-phosphate synthase/GTP cyclohydrolase II